MHIVATSMLLILMLAAIIFAAAASMAGSAYARSPRWSHRLWRASSRLWPRRTNRRWCWASPSGSASVPSCSGWRFSPLHCGVRRRYSRCHSAHKDDGQWLSAPPRLLSVLKPRFGPGIRSSSQSCGTAGFYGKAATSPQLGFTGDMEPSGLMALTVRAVGDAGRAGRHGLRLAAPRPGSGWISDRPSCAVQARRG